jgi:hypothetical protein
MIEQDTNPMSTVNTNETVLRLSSLLRVGSFLFSSILTAIHLPAK